MASVDSCQIGPIRNRLLVTIVGKADAEIEIPQKLRHRGFIRHDGSMPWTVEGKNSSYQTTNLTEEEKKLPIAVFLNHEMLCLMIKPGYRPENDCGEFVPLIDDDEKHSAESNHEGQITQICHFIYFSNQQSAQPLVERLLEDGFDVEQSSSFHEGQWLVLVRCPLKSTESDTEIIYQIEGLGKQLGGEYDGWEAEMH